MKIMAIQNYVEQIFPVECMGRDSNGNEVLAIPERVKVLIAKSPCSNTISSTVECPYNTGAHGQRCRASHPGQDKVLNGVICPYSFDIPYCLEVNH